MKNKTQKRLCVGRLEILYELLDIILTMKSLPSPNYFLISQVKPNSKAEAEHMIAHDVSFNSG